jgi:sucrose-6-phosphate hydrolase SacC (GH32 family)
MRLNILFLLAATSFAQVYAPPPPKLMWDTWVFQKGDEFHMFYLQNDPGKIWDSIGRAVSKDLIHWKTLPMIESQGPAGSWDSGPTLTGITIETGGKYLMFYAAEPKSGQSIGLMESSDLVSWKKHERNPLLISRPPHYAGADWRDMFVRRDAGTGLWHAYICARNAQKHAAVAHLTSTNLLDWTYLPPLFSDPALNDMEVPEPFSLGGRHYLVFSSVRSRMKETSGRKDASGTFYLVGDSEDGPYRFPAEPLFLGSGHGRFDVYVGRVLRFGGETLLYSQTVGGPVMWATPKVIRQNKDGSLWLGYWNNLDRLKARAFQQNEKASVKDGTLRLQKDAGDFMLECDLARGGAAKAGFVWRDADSKSSGMMLDRANGMAEVLENGKVIDDISIPGLGKRNQKIRILVRAHRAELYVNDRWLFNWRMKSMPPSGALSLTAVGGQARVSHMRINELEPLQ